MAKDLGTFEQVLDFFVRINPESVAKEAADLREVNARRVAMFSEAEDELAKISQRAADKRSELAHRELNTFEDMLAQKGTKEMQEIDRIIKANEEKYAKVADRAREAAKAGQDPVAAQDNDAAREQYSAYERNKEILERRKREVTTQESPFAQFMGEKGVGGKAVGIAKKLTGTAQGSTTATALDKMTGLLSGQLTVAAALKEVVSAILDSIQVSMQESKENERNQIAVQAGTSQGLLFGQSGSGGSVSAQKEIQRHIGEMFGSDAEKAEAKKAWQSLVSGAPNLTSTTGAAEQERIFKDLTQTADAMGMAWDDAAKEITSYSRRFGISIEESGMQLADIMQTGRDIAAVQAIDIQKYRKSVLEAADALKEFHVTGKDANIMVAKFAVELDKGLMSVQDIIKFQKGLNEQDPGTRAFLGTEFIKKFQGKGGMEGDMADKLAELSKGNAVALGEALKQIGDNDTGGSVAGAFGGANAAEMASLKTALNDFAMAWGKEKAGDAGGDNPLVADMLRRQFSAMFKLSDENETTQKQRIRETGGSKVDVADAEQRKKEVETQKANAAILHDNARDMGERYKTLFLSATKDIVIDWKESMSKAIGDTFNEKAANMRAKGYDTAAAMTETTFGMMGMQTTKQAPHVKPATDVLENTFGRDNTRVPLQVPDVAPPAGANASPGNTKLVIEVNGKGVATKTIEMGMGDSASMSTDVVMEPSEETIQALDRTNSRRATSGIQ